MRQSFRSFFFISSSCFSAAASRVHLRLQQLVPQVHPGTLPARGLQVAPRLLRTPVGARLGSVQLGLAQLGLHLRHVALGEGQFVLLRGALALEHVHALPVLRREPLGHLHRLLILDLGGEAATPLGVGEALALRRERGLGARQRLVHLLHRDPGLDHRLTHLPRQVPQVAGGRRGVQRGP